MSGRDAPILEYEVPPGPRLVGIEGRGRVASAIASFLHGEIDNLEFHNRTFGLETRKREDATTL